MLEPSENTGLTPKLGLPMLFAGQAQKEFFINQALTMIDTCLFPVIDEARSGPPDVVEQGAAYLVVGPASGAWSGQDGRLAISVGGDWIFVEPQSGMRVFDRDAGCFRLFRSGWQRAEAILPPSGGSVIDAEARSAINAIIAVLDTHGFFAN